MNKKNIAILFGGRSPEHNISLLSAKNIISALDKSKYNPILIGISKTGQWQINENSLGLFSGSDSETIALSDNKEIILLSQNANERHIVSAKSGNIISNIDVIFPVLHGTYGEDGSIQGLAKLADIPCVGCGIVGSAVGMDKDLMKRILRDAGIQVAPGITIRRSDSHIPDYQTVVDQLGSELFIKPANLGSSVGISFVKNEAAYREALNVGFQFDPKLLIESRIIGRELECAVLGNEHPQASAIGEVIPKDEFYSYENKYVDENGAALAIPANISEEAAKNIQNIAIETFKTLECRGLSRVDVFLTEDQKVIVNEINTIPGFTNISMYPKLWEFQGISNTELITKLIDLAVENHQTYSQLRIE